VICSLCSCNCPQVIICVIAVFWIQWSLTLVMLTVVPVVVLCAILYGAFVKRIGKRYQARWSTSIAPRLAP